MAVGVETSLGEVLGGKGATKLRAGLDLRTVGDLLHHYPRRYQSQDALTDLASLSVGDGVTVLAEVRSVDVRPYRSRRGWIVSAVIADSSGGTLEVTWFNQKWRADKLKRGQRGLFAGQVGEYRGKRQLTFPEFVLLNDRGEPSGRDRRRTMERFTRSLIPVYPASRSVASWDVMNGVAHVLTVLDRIPDPVPEAVRRAHGLPDLDTALRMMHQPDTYADVAAARRRLTWDEAFVLQVELARRRTVANSRPAIPRPVRPDGLLAEFDSRLPFALTAGQRSVGAEILADLARPHPMLRLLEGEVGSGKTVVALRAMLAVVDAGGQAVLLAPTEVLAQQHFRTVSALLGDLGRAGELGGAPFGTRIAVLTGSQGAAARREALLEAASGAAGIVIGTHALLQDTVQFADLGLVVVDEQHRFGVEQRDALRWKADTPPHVLVMTATPIPRTVAMTVYGDLETSVLRELPAGRAPIRTTLVPSAEKPGWLERVWERLREEVAAGRQAYVVCSRIGESPSDPDAVAPPQRVVGSLEPDTGTDTESEDGGRTAGVLATHHWLHTEVLPDLRVGLLHGRMSAEDKDAVMRGFAEGEYGVLVATTVIEVGVDVPNATVMVVLDADRFGVSQLHQLRGRVGRGDHEGLCLLESMVAPGAPARARLAAVQSTLDGFELARLDLEQRREGDVLGAVQAGRHSRLRLLSLRRDEELIALAREEARRLVAEDPSLAHHPDLAEAVQRMIGEDRAAFLEKA